MNRIEKIANEMNLDYVKNTASGKYQDYRFTLTQTGNKFNNQYVQKMLVFPIDDLTTYQEQGLNEYFKQEKKALSLFNWGKDGLKYVFQIMETFKQIDTEKFRKMLSIIVEGFKKYDVGTLSKCVFCQEENPDTEARVYQIMNPAHQECITKVKAAVEERASDYNNQSNKYPEGITGAIIGALIGIIPWVLVELFTGFYASVLAIIIGYSAFYFYKKFGGKVTSITKYIIIITTFLAILFTNIVVCSYIILYNDGALVIDNYILLYSDPEVGGYLLQSLGISVIIGGLGLFNVFKKVKSEEFTKAID